MGKSGLVFRASHVLSFETARTDTNENILILALKVSFNDESQPWSGGVAAAVNEEPPVEQESHHTEKRCEGNEDLIAGEVKSAVKELGAIEMATMVEEALDHVSRNTFHNRQGFVRSVVCNTL